MIRRVNLRIGLVIILWVIVLGLLGFCLTTTRAEDAAPWTPWSRPTRLLPYMRDAVLIQNPLDLSLGYVGADGAYGIVSGSEVANWSNDTYTQLSDQAPPDNAGYPGGVYDEFGTLHAAWGGRAESGQFRLYYNRVLKGSNNVGQPRDLTKEIMPQSSDYFGGGFIDYSRQQKKLFILFTTRNTSQIPSSEQVYFIESADQGTTWSSPLKLGEMTGYAPGRPELIVDSSGNPHIFYGVMAGDDSRSWYYHRLRVNGNWSAPEDITDGTRYRLFTPKVALGPDGDIWVAWTADQIDVAHWDSGNNHWQTFNSVSGKRTITGWPAIAVGSGGAVWVIWVERGSDNIGDWQLRFTIFREENWIPAQVGFVFSDDRVAKDLPWTRVGCLNALYAKGLIYLGMCIAVDDPQSVNVGLWLSTVPEGWFPGQVLPTSTPISTIATTTTRAMATLTPTAVSSATTTIPGGGGNNLVGSNPSSTPISKPPTPTLNPKQVEDTAQARAALTPVLVPMPLQPPGSGVGPELIVPTSTPRPAPTARPTPTSSPDVKPTVRGTGTVAVGQKPKIQVEKPLPPEPGWSVLPIAGGVFIGWGVLNWLSVRRVRKLARAGAKR